MLVINIIIRMFLRLLYVSSTSFTIVAHKVIGIGYWVSIFFIKIIYYFSVVAAGKGCWVV